MTKEAPFDIATSAVLDGVPHGFFGHAGGAHQFGYGGNGDEETIRNDRRSAADRILSGGQLVTPHQIHSSTVLTVTQAWVDTAIGRPEADSVVTATPGIVLGIVTADCAPVLFADKTAGVVGAAHAGWRGAHAGVLENTILAMAKLGAEPQRIAAAIGPTIAQASYEVDAPFKQHFADSDQEFFEPARRGHWQFDLPGYIRHRLMDAKIDRIEDLALDTYIVENKYYSYRRSSHRGEPNYGRQVSMIACG